MDTGYLSEAFVSFQGEGLHVGRRQLFLRLAGCPLRCRYCDTPASLVRTEQFVVHAPRRAGAAPDAAQRPNPVTLEDVAWAIDRLDVPRQAVDGTALTGGEPLAQVSFLATLLRSELLPRPRLLETAGTLPRELAQVVDLVDSVSMDIKLPSNTGETAFWKEHEEFLEVAAGKVYVKILVDDTTAVEELRRATALVAAAGGPVPVFLQPITDRKNSTAIHADGLAKLFAVARADLGDVRVVPQTHKMMRIR